MRKSQPLSIVARSARRNTPARRPLDRGRDSLDRAILLQSDPRRS
jgi:hypothetical protein